MKNIILKSAFILTVLLTATALTVSARSNNTLTYNRFSNPQIGVTAVNKHTVGRNYTICDERGKVVIKGTIRSAETFYISTQKLTNGTYIFKIDGETVQEFIIS